jgi:hypothetical protein
MSNPVVDLDMLVRDFAQGIEAVDARGPVWTSATTKRSYQAGIGPHPESETVRLVLEELAESQADRYQRYRLSVPYPGSTRQRCDLVLGDGTHALAVEIKLLRFMGDNGKPNDNMLMHILSPYPAHRSAVTDCEKLCASGIAVNSAVLIYGFDYDAWPMDPAVDAFELFAAQRASLGPRVEAGFDGLIHPIHMRGRVFGWAVSAL